MRRHLVAIVFLTVMFVQTLGAVNKIEVTTLAPDKTAATTNIAYPGICYICQGGCWGDSWYCWVWCADCFP